MDHAEGNLTDAVEAELEDKQHDWPDSDESEFEDDDFEFCHELFRTMRSGKLA